MIILNFLVCYTMIKCTSKVLTSLLSNKKSKQMLLRSVGRWSPGQLLAPSSWRSLNPPWLGYFFSFQWKITQRDPSARCFYLHQVSKEWKDNPLKGQFILHRHGLSFPPLKAAQDWSSNYHDGQGANCLSSSYEIRKENTNYVILFWIKVVF